jgi:hypothetical protein
MDPDSFNPVPDPGPVNPDKEAKSPFSARSFSINRQENVFPKANTTAALYDALYVNHIILRGK